MARPSNATTSCMIKTLLSCICKRTPAIDALRHIDDYGCGHWSRGRILARLRRRIRTFGLILLLGIVAYFAYRNNLASQHAAPLRPEVATSLDLGDKAKLLQFLQFLAHSDDELNRRLRSTTYFRDV